ncbi:hypothetical protein BBO99_00000621 [Phytophthora kernoviae]|uniref:Helicase ATP-binding domain-containing protein n=2 Tax=Phytophthora kernoviae TaxID=325452 RepID=A0A3R7GU36_9STRA|nr:hypothetical protein G195_001628 [Phytophthora kernoviae 00238/432]KAG2532936.1 hypothetical protein JM18_000905 [Phytophthora kernoviae]RLN43783.1 hypothetical protein BBI17_001438 [Phytophthora kernoviae]RLN85375.1 hypothetical protein BBO99_00000621 [Phytophthora kernoviae]
MADDASAVFTSAMDGEFFSFPYEPYDIQLQLMRQLWDTLERRHCGIFESPTGTGKSISLICGTLTWLTKHTDEYGLPQASGAEEKVDTTTIEEKNTEPSWLNDFAKAKANREVKHLQQVAKVALSGIEKLRLEPEASSKKRKMGYAYNLHEKKRPNLQYQGGTKAINKQDGEDEEEHLVDAYDSDRVGQSRTDSDDEDRNAHVQDIEDLHQLGEDMSICSYYGTRESIPLAQIVTVPYSMILSKDTRESLGITLEDSIVIFDEAHNIIDAINNTYKPVAADDPDEGFESRHISPLRIVEALLKALTSAGADGRILAQPHNANKKIEGVIKFILLNPVTHFQEVVEKSRSVILAGGTMQPVSQVIDQLFSSVPKEDVDLFSCGHVIPPENLLGFSLALGPSQKHLEFTYSRRDDMEALDELGRILLNLSRIVPGGVVVFFPSYRFEENAIRRWQATKQYDQIQAKKTVFSEPKKSGELADVLAQYSAACSRGNRDGSGAILFSVVGGKMSEGINFSDELARCVVMVGMPYPNARDVELVEKMAFLDKRNPGSGRQFYESLCMKAVNQSIGRAIRHQKDYASILLVDQRYSNPQVRKRLPEWIQKRVQPPSQSFGQAYSQLVQFYRTKGGKNNAR